MAEQPATPNTATVDPEDSIRIALDELGRGTMAAAPDDEDSALAPISEPANVRSDETEREIHRNLFPTD